MLDNLSQMPKDSSAHIDVFAERYDKLIEAARSLTNNNQRLAMELVHDALIKFVRHSPDLHKINNLDGYLRTLISNLFKSQKRLMNVQSECELSIENYDSVESKLSWTADRYCNPHLLLQIQDILRVICEYACFRKERLKVGSVLILRFFHGYHTSEIATIMRVTASAVSHQLKIARSEIDLYLNNPKHLGFSQEIARIQGKSRLNYGCLADDLIGELRRAIFQSPSCHKCIWQFKLHKLYGGQYQREIDCKTLAHIVSCADCLDGVNTLLGLELLSMRYPADTLSRYTKDWKMYTYRVARQEAIVRRAILTSIHISYGD
jgi:DNA-directed RNA polymerase specialized sigma24 family protein